MTQLDEPRFSVGTEYSSRGKFPRVCQVVDILKTYNSKNELVEINYVSTHEFAGQTVTNYEVPEATIVRGIL